MKGITWQPVPGSKSDHIPMETDDDGKAALRSEEDTDHVDYNPVPREEDVDTIPKTKMSKISDIQVSSRDTETYGFTPGCPACSHAERNSGIPPGVSHSVECRKRIRDAIELDEETRERESSEQTPERQNFRPTVVPYRLRMPVPRRRWWGNLL